MCPEFFHVGPMAIRAYGVTLALSFLIGLWIVRRQARVIGLDPERIANLAFVLILFGVIGGRLGYVLYHLDYFTDHPLSIINPFGNDGNFGIAGLNLQGGLVLGLIAGALYLRRRRISIAAGLDAVVPAVGFGIFLTRIGCFLNGCCFGVPTDSFLGVRFPADSPVHAVFGAEAVHPTQLYSSAYGLALFVLLSFVNRKWYRAGRTIGLFFVLESIMRIAIEPLRYYEGEMLLESGASRVTYNQIVGLGLLVVGLMFLFHRRTAQRAPSDTAQAS
ncbi:MAG TPA: prolipoprotein diacylglyceryl transferase [candidate division Zixibacteria bacterium]|jgi:phosphatidylglycerol:prolipoprotein diacylglycerol transferase